MPAKQIAGLMLWLAGPRVSQYQFCDAGARGPAGVGGDRARPSTGGLHVPIVYNTSAYDSVESLRLLEGLVDIYMPDFKFWRSRDVRTAIRAQDYPQRAREAIAEMHRQVGPLQFRPDGLACRGVLVRHLVMPGQLAESAAIFRYLAQLSPDTFVNVMGQYRPQHRVGVCGPDGQRQYADINRRPTREEMVAAHQLARDAGLWRFDK